MTSVNSNFVKAPAKIAGANNRFVQAYGLHSKIQDDGSVRVSALLKSGQTSVSAFAVLTLTDIDDVIRHLTAVKQAISDRN